MYGLKVKTACNFIVNLMAIVTFCLIITGCGVLGSKTSEPKQPTKVPTSTTTAPTPTVFVKPSATPDPLKAQIAQMTLDEKIGQMVLVGIDGVSPNDQSKALIEQYHVGGVIFYQNNIENTTQILDFVNALKNLNRVNKIPLFFSLDQEGGSVSRMPAEFTKFPTNQAISKWDDPKLSFRIGAAIAEEIKSVGFNLDFAPVLDINSNPKNPVIGDRSFGDNPQLVEKLGVQTMLGIQSQQVIPVVKHFPGHGDTSVDSHLELPVVYNSLSRLRSFEWIPFADAISHHADMVMVAHILLPQIDPNNPASMSHMIITDQLRGMLQFHGVVITDDLTMGAIVKHYTLEQAAIKAVNAGSDIVMVAHGYDAAVSVISALKQGVVNGVISQDQVDQSVYRIVQLKQKYALSNQQITDVDVSRIDHDVEQVLTKAGR